MKILDDKIIFLWSLGTFLSTLYTQEKPLNILALILHLIYMKTSRQVLLIFVTGWNKMSRHKSWFIVSYEISTLLGILL